MVLRKGLETLYIYIRVYLKTRPILKETKLSGFSPQANYTDRATARLSAKLVPTFADRRCRVVSETDSHGR
jgi:hypothetical protein